MIKSVTVRKIAVSRERLLFMPTPRVELSVLGRTALLVGIHHQKDEQEPTF
jgi:hypothetical protein